MIPTIFSFLPQLLRVWRKKDFTGISLVYVLCNLLTATEELTLMWLELVNNTMRDDDPPKTVGDWINLAQLAAVSVLFLVLYSLTLIVTSYIGA